MKINGSLAPGSTGGRGRILGRLALAAGSCLAVLVFLPSLVKAQPSPITDGYRIDLSKVINGAEPDLSSPWMVLEITQAEGGPLSILLNPMQRTVDGKLVGLADGEFITKVGLNLTDGYLAQHPDPYAGLSSVGCTVDPSTSTVCSNYSLQTTIGGYQIEGNAVGGFDLGIDFFGTGKDGGSGRLTNAKKVRLDIFGTSLTPEALLGTVYVNAYKGDVNVAAKVQGISDGGSGVIGDPPGNGTPVPGPLPILGAAAAFQASRRLRRRLKPAAVGTLSSA